MTTKKQLAQILSNLNQQLPLDLSLKTITILTEEISNTLVNNNKIEIRGFGTLSIRQTKEKSIHNPKTMEIVASSSQKRVYFKSSI